jgi:hypothetical protein
MLIEREKNGGTGRNRSGGKVSNQIWTSETKGHKNRNLGPIKISPQYEEKLIL